MRMQEQQTFADALACAAENLSAMNLLEANPTPADLQSIDVVLVGGSGAYSATAEGEWLDRALQTMRDLYEWKQPTFASCWGFQAMARALGGTVIHDAERAEIGSLPATVTEAGRADPVFGDLPSPFLALMGHEDRVSVMPRHVTPLVSTERVPNQAFSFPDRGIWATQFHPELTRERYLQRLQAYPRYVEEHVGMPYHEFVETCQETPDAATILGRYLDFLRR